MSSTECQKKEFFMFINKSVDGKNNICRSKIATLRKEMKISQRVLADKLQLIGLDVDKNAIQRIESGQRFITDIELVYLASALNVSIQDLFCANMEDSKI